MATNIGVKIGVDGAAQFKSSLRSVDTELKSLSSEMKAATAEFKGNESSQDALAKKTDILSRTYDTAQKKVKLLSTEYDKQSRELDNLASALETAIKENGESSDEAKKAQQAYDKQKDAVNKLSGQLHNAEADMYNVRNAEKAVGEEADTSSKKTSTFGDTLKSILAAGAIKAGLDAIGSAIKKVGQFCLDSAKETADYADEVTTLATQYNLTTDQVQEFMYMEDLADVSMETIAGSLTKLTKNMGAAQEGTGDAAAAFDKLGVSIYDSNGELRSSQEVFMDAIEALGDIENATERDTVSMELFGKGAQDLNPLIALGAEGFKDLAAEAHQSGAVMSGEALDGAVAFSDQLARAKEKGDALKRELGQALAPAFEDVIEQALAFAEKIDWDKVGAVISGAFRVISGAIELAIEDFKRVKGWAEDAIGAIKDFLGIQSEVPSGYGPPSGTGGGGTAGGGAGRGGSPGTSGTPDVSYQERLGGRSRSEVYGAGAWYGLDQFSATTGGAKVVINTQSISQSTIDYVVAQVNSKLGARA